MSNIPKPTIQPSQQSLYGLHYQRANKTTNRKIVSPLAYLAVSLNDMFLQQHRNDTLLNMIETSAAV